MLNAILIDDEKFALETLALELETHCPEVEIIAKCNNAKSGLAAIMNNKPDLVFLDIEMPVMNGFELLMQLPCIDFGLIFTTAYDQFALKAIKLNALDYLLKPFSGEELRTAVNRYRQQAGPKMDVSTIARILSEMADRQSSDRLILPTAQGVEIISLSRLLVVEADNNYVHLYQRDGKRVTAAKTLKEVTALLKDAADFVRVHQSFLVNLRYVSRYQKGQGGQLTLEDGRQIPVSRSRKEILLEQLGMG